MSSNNAAEGGGWFGSISSMYDYASSSISSMLGYEDLDVVDPTSSTAAKGLPQDDGGRNQEERKQIWGTKQFQQYIGMDVTSLLSVPVWIMEPFTILQKMAEMMEYTELLDQADTCEDEFERMALVVAFTITPFGSSERAWKPFNPILGETFELQTGKGVTYMAEQVSHHPPVGASHAENKHFSYDLVSAPATKFLGNSLEVYPHGRTRIHLKSTGEVFTLLPPNAKVNNIVIGRTWVDNCGQLVLINSNTGSRCELEFTPCGWFGYGRYEYSGHISDKDGVKRLKVSGKWNTHVEVVRCDEDGEPLEDDEPRRLWTCSEKPEGDYYGFTHFAHELNSCEGQATPLPSDSRRRPDRYLLETGESTAANSAKYELEEMQRAERKEREAKGDGWTPRWFRLVEKPELLAEEPDTEKVPFWEFTGEYMQRTAVAPAKADEVLGKGFCPWQYPDLHTKKE